MLPSKKLIKILALCSLYQKLWDTFFAFLIDLMAKFRNFATTVSFLAKKQFTLTTSKLIRLLNYCIMRDILSDTFLGALTEIPAPLNVGLQDGMDASVL